MADIPAMKRPMVKFKRDLKIVDPNLLWERFITDAEKVARNSRDESAVYNLQRIKEDLRRAFVVGVNAGAHGILNQLPDAYQEVKR